MKGFALGSDGDVKILDGQIQMVDGDKLLKQTCQTILGTNRGEWALNPEEGINFHLFRGKRINYDAVQKELLAGLQEIDNSFTINSFDHEVTADRKLHIRFTAECSRGTVTGENTY